jgi:hypothetical protein
MWRAAMIQAGINDRHVKKLAVASSRLVMVKIGETYLTLTLSSSGPQHTTRTLSPVEIVTVAMTKNENNQR